MFNKQVDICAGNICFSSGQRPSEASDVGSDVHMFVGTQKRASSVAFEEVMPAQQLTAFQHGGADCMCVLLTWLSRPSLMLAMHHTLADGKAASRRLVLLCLFILLFVQSSSCNSEFAFLCFCDQHCYHKMELKRAHTPLKCFRCYPIVCILAVLSMCA